MTGGLHYAGSCLADTVVLFPLLMAIPRFYCPAALSALVRMELPQSIAHHAVRVLRLTPDSDIILFDGRGGEYPATLSIDGKKGYAQIGTHRTVEAELVGDITLVQGIAASDKMDWIVEKAVELGAKRLIPVTARRSVLQLSGERLAKRQRHWNSIAQSASEQCGRNRIMQIDAPASLAHWLDKLDGHEQKILFCHPGAGRTLAQALQNHTGPLVLLVGPEGGWSDDEQALVKRHSLTAVRFGDRVLRTETAGPALIAAASALLDWL